MIGPSVKAARILWSGRGPGGGNNDRRTAYTLYILGLLALTAGAPFTVALWRAAVSPSGAALLITAAESNSFAILTVLLWAGALLIGRLRGPALHPPLLLHVLVASAIPRSYALCGPLVRTVLISAVMCAGAAAFIGAALVSVGAAQSPEVFVLCAAAVAVGIITIFAALIGQVWPRIAPFLTLGFLALAVSTATGFLPAPPFAFSPAILAGVAATAVSLMVAAPSLLQRLSAERLEAQAARWQLATAFSFTLDFGAASHVYVAGPRHGRRLRAVMHGAPRWRTFFVRDAVGAFRRPGRSLAAIGALALAGTCLALSFMPGSPSLVLAGIAGVTAYLGSGPLAQGLQHGLDVAGDYPLYGVSDRVLARLHSLFPLTLVTGTLTVAALVTGLLAIGTHSIVAVGGALALSALTLITRFSRSLKAGVPPTLAAPIASPVGDLSIVTQLVCAFIDPALAILGTMAVSLFPHSPVPLLLAVALTCGSAALRWKRRR